MRYTGSHGKLLTAKNHGPSWATGSSQIPKSRITTILADIGWQVVEVKRMRDRSYAGASGSLLEILKIER
jgi:hypothetical protein